VEPYVSEEDIEDVTNEYSDEEITKKKKKKQTKSKTNYNTSESDESDVEQQPGAVEYQEDGEVMDEGELDGAEETEEYHGAEDTEERNSTGDRERITEEGAYKEADDPLSD